MVLSIGASPFSTLVSRSLALSGLSQKTNDKSADEKELYYQHDKFSLDPPILQYVAMEGFSEEGYSSALSQLWHHICSCWATEIVLPLFTMYVIASAPSVS